MASMISARYSGRPFAAVDRSSVVVSVNDAHPELLRWNTASADTEFVQRVLERLAAVYPAEEWGHIHKSAGENGHTLPNGVRVSHDVIKSRLFERQVDIIHGAAAHPSPGGAAWQVIDPSVYRPSNVWTAPQNVIFNSDAPDSVEAQVARLGRGFFWLLRGLKDTPEDVTTQWKWLMEEEAPEVIRAFLDLEGGLHTMGGTLPDPWRDAGIDGRDPDWPRLVAQASDLALRSGVMIHWTVYGGPLHYRTLDERRRFNDQIVRTLGPYWDAVYGFHVANEYNVNGFSEREVQDAGADLFSKVPGQLRRSLSSPALAHGADQSATNEDMQDSFVALYGADVHHFGANTADLHISRDLESKWADPFAYNLFLPALDKTNHEPFGQGASAGGDISDPGMIVGHYQRSSEAGQALYVAHSAWSAWGGRLPVETIRFLADRYGKEYARLHTIRNVWEMPNQKPISNGLRHYRASGIVDTPPPDTLPPDGGGGQEMPIPPYDEAWISDTVRPAVVAKYAEHGAPLDDLYPVWITRTQYDYNAGTHTKEASLEKHLAELDAALAG